MITPTNKMTSASNSTSTSNSVSYNLLDTKTVDNCYTSCIAILRKIQFRNTKDGKPYIRASFEDINGLIVIGRMFDISMTNEQGKMLRGLVGGLCKISYSPDYFGGSLGLAIKAIAPVDEATTVSLTEKFSGKYTMAVTMLRECNRLLINRNFDSVLDKFRLTYCNLQSLADYSDERISKGLRGYVLNIIYKTLLACSEVSNAAVVAFLYAVITECNTEQTVDAYLDDGTMTFIASMMDKRIEAAAANMHLLSAKISEFAALFTDKAKVISHDSYILYKIYRDLCEASNIAVIESQLPPQGFGAYKGYTIRKE